MDRKIKPLDLFSQRGRPLIHIRPTNVNIVEGQSHTITCSISSISDITDITWIKTTAVGYEIVDVVGVDGKFSGGTLSDPSLTINNIVKSDEGTYVCRATNCFGTASSEYSVLTFKEFIEVEMIQKGPIAVGYGGTIRINAKIISNSARSLEVNWQKTHNNVTCSTTLMINCLKYSGSSCNVNNPELVINNFDKEDAGIYKLEVTSTTETKSSPGILLELYGDEADSLSKEESNFFRLYFLCQKIATQAVRLFFDSKVPGLDSFLKQHKSNLTSTSSVYRCTWEQKAILFPGGQVAVVSTDFDFTLLYKLIRNLLTAIPAPTCGWGNQPLPGHLNETDDIERIRHLRNNLAHNSEFEICDTDFSTHWTDLSQTINRLSKGSLSTEVESMRTKKFDKCIKNEMEEDIRNELKEIRVECMELNQKVTEFSTDIAENKQKIYDINDRHIPLNIRKGHIELIKKWRIEDKLFYDKTGGFKAALKMVQSENYMTIIGGPGSGKTATARHIALQLEEQGWEVVPVCRLDKIIQYGDRDHKQVFVLDDVLGIFAVDMNIYNHIMNHQENIVTTIGGTSKLLFTCRKSVYKEALKLGLFVTENIIDLQNKDNQLTETEKIAICKYHCENKDVSPDLYTSLSFTKANHMFPFLCKVFSREEKYQQLGESFFNKPFEYFISELDKLQRTNTIQYAVLVLCLVNGSKLSVDLLPHEHMQKVFNNCGVNLGTPEKQIIDAIFHMSETYFTKLETEYTFTHDFIFEVIAYHYGRQNQHHILKYLSSSYIGNKVTVCEQASNQDLCIHLSEDMYLPLAERLYKDIQSMNLFDVFMNKSLKHGLFLDVCIGMLKRKPFDEFESLILKQHENIRHFVQKTLSLDKRIQKRTDFIEPRRLYLLFDTVYCEKSGSKHSVRVISWIINYGHTHLLQEIVNHVKYSDHSIELIFGSDVMENTRLLLLGCYSNTLDIVELILKYVDAKCIDMDLMSCVASYDIGSNYHRQYTPLTVACATGNLGIVKALLRNNADANKCNYRKLAPSIVATKQQRVDVARCLLSSGADINLCECCGKSPLFIASEEGHCDIVKELVAHNADVNLTDEYNRSPLYSAAEKGHYDIVLFLLQNGADLNIPKLDDKSSLYVASSSGHYDIVRLLITHGALSAGNAKSQFKTISKRINVNEIHSDSNALHNPCGYPEEKIICSKEKQEEEKEAIYIPKVQEGKEETTFTREQEEKEKIIHTREKKEENEETIDRRKEQLEKGEFIFTKGKNEVHVEIYGQDSFSISYGRDAILADYSNTSPLSLLTDYGNTSPLSIAVQKGHFDIVKYILENTTDFNLSDTGKPPLLLAAEKGYHDIVALLLHSRYNDIAKTYLDTTPLEIAVWKNKTMVVQLLIQEENKLQKYRGNYHLFEILVDLKRSEFCINEKTNEEDCHTKDRNHRHLPYSLWHIIDKDDNDNLAHLLKIGLDVNKRDYNGNTLLYRILSRPSYLISVYHLKLLMKHFEDVNVGGNEWIFFLETKRRLVRATKDINNRHDGILKECVPLWNNTLSEFRKHVRRHSI